MIKTERDFFDDAARHFGSGAVLVPGANVFRNMIIDKAMKKTLIPILSKLQNCTILEVGCGIGRWTQIMAKKNSVLGVDISRSMIALAKMRCKGRNCSFVIADVSYLPFRKEVFDVIISITVLQHILNKKKLLMALSEIANCCKSWTLFMEEMWSDREISLRQVYCPTHVTPLELYVKRMMNVGLQANSFSGVNPAVLAVSLTRLLASREKVIEGDFSEKVKSSKLLSKLVHFAMGIGVLSAVFLPQGKYNPHLSLHTILTCRKERNRMKQIVFVRESTEP